MPLSTREHKLVQALGEVLFTRDRVLAIDAEDAGVVSEVEAHVERLPKLQRVQIRALLLAFDRGFGLWARAPTRRLADATFEERRAYVEACSETPEPLRRQAWEALHAVLLMAFVESPLVLEAIGARREDRTRRSA